MTAFTSRWLGWEPRNTTGRRDIPGGGVEPAPPAAKSETPIERTDRTDKRASVSFVSPTPKGIQPETGAIGGVVPDADGANWLGQAKTGFSPSGWEAETAGAIAWFMASESPAEPFVLVWSDRGARPAVKITSPEAFWRSLRTDIEHGPSWARSHYGALQDDLRRLHGLFGGGH